MRVWPKCLAAGLLLVALPAVFACGSGSPATGNVDTIVGVVRDASGPVSSAIVRVQATTISANTDSEGRFQLTDLPQGESVVVTAWAPGYFIGGGDEVLPGGEEVDLVLTAHPVDDNPDYDWLPSGANADEDESKGCAECHSQRGTHWASPLPVDEWRLDAHSQSAENPRFLTLYTGTDVYGNQSPLTRLGYSRDYGSFPLRPDPSQPYYGPGYKLDFPETAGNCGACHAPAASVAAPYGVDPTKVSGVGAEGVGCDFCHKVWDVRLNTATGLPDENMPGVLSFDFRRPFVDHQFFAGPLDDVAPGEDTYSPLQQTGQYCAPCHFGVFWGTIVYNSFGEWLESPYSDPETGRTCQDCHMPNTGATHFVLPDKGGVTRDPSTVFSHSMPGAADQGFLQDALTMTTDARRDGETIVVQVDLTNDNTGHHIPTDSPLRHLILLVQAAAEDGTPLAQLDGPVVPEWGGAGDPSQGYYAGRPGTAYAKVLQELWTEVAPTGAYWNQTRVLSDNRIQAFATDSTTYTFMAPASGPVNVSVILLFRRAFIELMDLKGWDVPDTVMAERSITLTGSR
jgi:mono/diheme cytochrome c family protein